ncbi:MAG: hypothetical protein LC745_09810, partial [Planctomycetia bacterium]|nr:hypothetical protein [Planctomycetia bacterium]
MNRLKLSGLLLLGALGLAGSAGLTLRAQGPRESQPDPRPTGSASVQDALHKPYHFTFVKPTPLDEVARHLGRTLNAPVAVDRAALDRMGLKVNDEVQLDLAGVRLKTGLKLLLDQLDLTYRVVPEDNLLIITDETGSADPIDHVLSEIKALHRDLHAVQDAVEEIRTAMGLDDEAGAK